MIRYFNVILLIFVFQYGDFSFAQYENVERIISYDSEITINEDASMIIAEKIKVYATGEKIKRGIFRDFPTKYKDEYGNNININFEVLEILRDGNTESYHTEKQINGIRVYCGKSNVLVPKGEHTYLIKYKTDRQIGYFKKFDELYWNVTGNGWDFMIERVTATVNLPQNVSKDDLKLFGYTGRTSFKSTDYRFEIVNNQKIVFYSTTLFYPGEGLTIVVEWPKGLVHEPTNSEKLVYFAKDNQQVIFGIIGIVILMIYYLFVWIKVGKDPTRGIIIPLYEPPLKMSAGAVRFIKEMGYDSNVFTSVIVSLAVKGYLKIEEEGNGYTLVRSKSDKPLSSEERAVLDKLGLSTTGIRNALELKQTNHTILQSAIKALKASLKNNFEKNYFITNRNYFFIGLAISLLILILSILGGSAEQIFILIWISIWSIGVSALLLAVFKAWKGVLSKGRGKVTAFGSALFITLFSIPFIGGEILGAYFLSEVSSPLMIFLIGLIVLLNIVFYHLLKAPTLLGRKIMDQIEGFKMYLGVAERDQIYSMKEPDKTPDLFESYLPFALALGVENKWAEKFSNILAQAKEGAETYKPLWYSGTGWSTLGAAGFASSLSGSFSSSISSSSTAPGSTSGGGGGGSSGGGGGGGGGGGW